MEFLSFDFEGHSITFWHNIIKVSQKISDLFIWIGLEIENDDNKSNQNFNTRSHNMPILNYFEIILLFPMVIGFFCLFVYLNFTEEFYVNTVLVVEIITENLIGLIIPLYIIIKKKAIRTFLWNEIKNQWFIKC